MGFIAKLKKSILARCNNYVLKNREYRISADYFTALNEKNNFFHADLEKCIDSFGFKYQNGWQYFSQLAANIYQNNDDLGYKFFLDFLTKHNYSNVYEGHLIAFEKSESLKQFSPSTLAFLLPWSGNSIDTVEMKVKKVIDEEGLVTDKNISNPLDNVEHLATNHFNRMKKIVENVKAFGYKQISDVYDPVSCYVLRKDDEVRYLIFSGQHRVAAATAANSNQIVLSFKSNLVIDKKDINDWPLVKQGVWDKADAEKYFDHLFEFDSKSWATTNGFKV